MNIQHLVDMANDIAANMAAEPDRDEAIAAMALHLQRFWEPRMRSRIIALCRDGGHGLDPLAVAAIGRLQQPAPS